MIRVFISQPMRGFSESEIELVRSIATTDIKQRLGDDVIIIDSVRKQGEYINRKQTLGALWQLGHCIELLSTADVVYFARGWQESRGCRIEHLCAQEYGITTMYA